MGNDIRVAIRGFLRTPGFTATATVTLALCLGATLTIFSVIDSVLVRGLPFPAADRLVAIYNSYPNAGVLRDGASPTNYYERRKSIPAFESVSLYKLQTAIVGDAGATRRDDVGRVTSDFFQTLGVAPAQGRTFREEEMNRGTDDVVILTDALWRDQFAGDPKVLGRTLQVDGVMRTIVGVLPPAFRFLSSKARLYIPYATRSEQRLAADRHSGSGSEMIARLRLGISLEEAQAQLDAHDARLAPTSPDFEMMKTAGFHSIMLSLHADHVAAVRPQLLLLQGAV
ncbi:MAG: ABC transporter permease, partial [Gemmatimonadaceae bacterium]